MFGIVASGSVDSDSCGPTTAAAMVLSKLWDAMVIPIILCGVFGYAIATFIGIGLGTWLRG